VSARPRFASVVLDVDSTLCGVEGVDWLARLRGDEIARASARLTDRAMNGEIAIEAVYGQRMALIRPTRAEMRSLSDVYRETLAPGAAPAIAKLRRAGVRLVLVSGGFRPAIAPVAKKLGFEDTDLFAVDVYWKESGEYAGFESASPLTTQDGKLQVVRKAGLERPILAVGDGSTDLGMRPGVDEFAAFTGFARRAAIVRDADLEITTYDELVRYVLDSHQKATVPDTNFHK
jgi:phosphoserine phosphatase